MRSIRRRGVASRLVPSLNLLALVTAFAGLLLPLTQMSPERFVDNAHSLAAASGVSLSAAVPSNPYNTLAQQLSDREKALEERESAMNKAETPAPTLGEIMGFVSFALSLILCVLVGINFYLDSRRGRRSGMLANKFSVDLR